MNAEYKVGDFIYNADIYDGLNNSPKFNSLISASIKSIFNPA